MRKKKGNATITSVVICLSIILIMCVVFEYLQMLIISTGVKNGVRSAVVSCVVANYDEAYSQLREGYSGDYMYSDKGFEEKIDSENVMGRLSENLGLSEASGKYFKYKSDGSVEYTLSNLKLSFENTKYAQGNANKNLNAKAFIDVEIPVRFGGRDLPPLNYTLKVEAEYMPKF